MVRAALIILALAAAAVAAGLLAEMPGAVTLEWQGYRVDTSAAFFALLVLAALVLLLVAARLLGFVVRLPRWLSGSERDRRQRRGYAALSRGLVAVAAGDAAAAEGEARRAASLLGGEPLALLLSAQAAQLQGNDETARQLYTQLSERPGTELVGLRGLLTLAMKREAWEDALALARRALRLDAKTPWAVETLFDLQKRLGQWVEASRTLGLQEKLKMLPAAGIASERARLFYQKSLDVAGEDAQRWAREALKADPSFTPAAVRLAQLLIAAGRSRKAAQVIERAWRHHPDPDLLEVYFTACQCHDALQKVAAAERLARENPEHIESRLAVAVAAMEARQWPQARAALEAAAGESPSPRVCKLMAELEEAEHGDYARAALWLRRAMGETVAPPPATTLAAVS